MTAEPEPLFEFTWSRWNRSLEAFLDFVFWGGGAFMATIALLQWQFPDWTPHQRGNPAVVVGVIVGLVAPWYRFLLQYHTIRVYPDVIELHRGAGSVQFRPSEVIGLVAQSGLNWNRLRDMDPEHGELIVWRNLVILTDFNRYVLPFDLIVCPWLYDSLREVCPLAWGLPYPGDLEPPAPRKPRIGNEDSPGSLGRLRLFYRRQVLRTAILGLGLVAGGSAFVVAVLVGIFLRKFDHINGKGLVALVLMIGAGLLILRNTPRDVRVLGMIRDADEGWEIIG